MEKGDTIAKFLSYENRFEIKSVLTEDMTLTEIGKKLYRDRTTIIKEIRNYAIEKCAGYSIYPSDLSES